MAGERVSTTHEHVWLPCRWEHAVCRELVQAAEPVRLTVSEDKQYACWSQMASSPTKSVLCSSAGYAQGYPQDPAVYPQYTPQYAPSYAPPTGYPSGPPPPLQYAPNPVYVQQQRPGVASPTCLEAWCAAAPPSSKHACITVSRAWRPLGATPAVLDDRFLTTQKDELLSTAYAAWLQPAAASSRTLSSRSAPRREHVSSCNGSQVATLHHE